jgi:hypothetical protein
VTDLPELRKLRFNSEVDKGKSHSKIFSRFGSIRYFEKQEKRAVELRKWPGYFYKEVTSYLWTNFHNTAGD